MNENEDIKIKELLSSAYGVTPDPELQKRMEKERVRIMRELPRGIRSPLITLRLVLMMQNLHSLPLAIARASLLALGGSISSTSTLRRM